MSKKSSPSFRKFIDRTRDFAAVARGVWFNIFFNLVAAVAFLLLAQGKDILFSIAEEVGYGSVKGIWMLITLPIALFFWSICSEFSTRVLIYLTDNSGRSLSPGRVDNRKRYQYIIGLIALFYPVILLIIAFVINLVDNYALAKDSEHAYDLSDFLLGSIILIVLLVIMGLFLRRLYTNNRLIKLAHRHKSLNWMAVSIIERNWLKHLYGMLSEVRVNIPTQMGYTGKDLPRGKELPDGITLPDSKYFYPSNDNPVPGGKQVEVWMFCINIRFYHTLLRQLGILAALSAVVIVGVGFFFPVGWDMAIGSATIIFLAFAAWQVIYLVLHFLDKAQPVPIRLLLVVWMLVCSYINHDHPIRTMPGKAAQRITLQHHFKSWLNNARNDSARSDYYRVNDSIPVIFVSAEGGALRTGAFSGLTLAHLQKNFPSLRNYLYCYSTVSGGSLGSNFFNAQLMCDKRKPRDTTLVSRSEIFFQTDFLSPAVAKLLFGEIINYFIPWHIKRADRAIALEESFEKGWADCYGNRHNILRKSFNQTVGDTTMPVILINTTEVESGLQDVWSNVELDSIPLQHNRDLYWLQNHFKGDNTNISYSSAINLSDRFPLVSPAGCFFRSDKNGNTHRLHYIDGGYYENKGSETLLQVLQALNLKKMKVKCYVLQFNFGGAKSVQDVRFANEPAEIVDAVYNTRSGRGEIAQQALKKYVRDTLKGEFIHLNLQQNTNELPMNWVLSSKVLSNLDQYIQQLVDTGKSKPAHLPDSVFSHDAKSEMNKLFFYNAKYKHPAKTADKR